MYNPTEEDIERQIDSGTTRRGLSGRGISPSSPLPGGGLPGALPTGGLPVSGAPTGGLPTGGLPTPSVSLSTPMSSPLPETSSEDSLDVEDDTLHRDEDDELFGDSGNDEFSDGEWGDAPSRVSLSDIPEEDNLEDEPILDSDENEFLETAGAVAAGIASRVVEHAEDEESRYNDEVDSAGADKSDTLVLIKNNAQRIGMILFILGLIVVGVVVLRSVVDKISSLQGTDTGLSDVVGSLRGQDTDRELEFIGDSGVDEYIEKIDNVVEAEDADALKEAIKDASKVENEDEVIENEKSTQLAELWDLDKREDLSYDSKSGMLTYRGKVTESIIGVCELCDYIKIDDTTISIVTHTGFRTDIKVNELPSAKGTVIVEVFYSMQQEEPVYLRFKQFK